MNILPFIRFLVVAFGVAQLMGCSITSTKIASHLSVDPDVKNSFTHILAIGDYDDIELREAVETKLQNDISKKTVCVCTRSIDVLSVESRELTRELLGHVGEMEVDAIIIVGPRGFLDGLYDDRKTTIIFGDVPQIISYSRATASFKSYLVQAATLRKLWSAEGVSSGNVFSGNSDVVRAAAGKTVDRLIDDRLLERRGTYSEVAKAPD